MSFLSAGWEMNVESERSRTFHRTSANQCLHRETSSVCFCTAGWWDKWAFEWWRTSERHVHIQSAHGQTLAIAARWLSSDCWTVMKLFANVKQLYSLGQYLHFYLADKEHYNRTGLTNSQRQALIILSRLFFN